MRTDGLLGPLCPSERPWSGLLGTGGSSAGCLLVSSLAAPGCPQLLRRETGCLKALVCTNLAGWRVPCARGNRTSQELAEVEVVLRDHVRDHLLVQADGLEQGGSQKDGLCVI